MSSSVGFVTEQIHSYSWLARNVIIFLRSKTKEPAQFLSHQAKEGISICLFKTFQLSSLLRVENSAF